MEVHPDDIIEVRTMGGGDINNDFCLKDSDGITPVKFVPCYIRVHFQKDSGSNTSSNPLTISISAVEDTHYNNVLHVAKAAGYQTDGSGDVSVRFDDLDCKRLLIGNRELFQGDVLHLAWTNPHSGEHTWGIAVGLANKWR